MPRNCIHLISIALFIILLPSLISSEDNPHHPAPSGELLCRGFIKIHTDTTTSKQKWKLVDNNTCANDELCAAQVKYHPEDGTETINWFDNYCEEDSFLKKLKDEVEGLENLNLVKGCYDYKLIVAHASPDEYTLAKTVNESDQYLCYCKQKVDGGCNSKDEILKEFKVYKDHNPNVTKGDAIKPGEETTVAPEPEEITTAAPNEPAPHPNATTAQPAGNATGDGAVKKNEENLQVEEVTEVPTAPPHAVPQIAGNETATGGGNGLKEDLPVGNATTDVAAPPGVDTEDTDETNQNNASG